MATTTTARDPSLVSALSERNVTFATLLSLIPQQYYVGPSEEQLDSRWMKNKKRKTGDEIKEHKRRAKQEKLDPSNLSATVDDTPATEVEVAVASSLPAPLPPAASITDLRERMREKLDRFKRDRGFDDPQSRDALEAAARQRRGEMRDRRRKERKDAIRRQREEVNAKPAKTQLIVPEARREVGAADDVILPSVALPSSKTVKAPLKKLANPSQALAHLEKHNARIAQLPDEKRRAALDRDLWAKAEARAAGTKIADEEKVLKKAVKREEKRKSKSGKAWNERKVQLERSEAAKIAKRNDNLASRAEGKRNKRLGIKSKDPKKGKGTPGFGGKKGGKGGRDREGRDDKGKGGKGMGGKDKKARAGAKA
ncbi:hypothetical protein CspeluHIS016_0702970 [Cutaneotrichosporon spelunceum]|uniref:SURF6-domain-containing protein n=1 Tax=Cutaneotrichosporon spelunceum TaxID=1672016 RepID=A0AAD3TYM2_9TREE|nr:hypothetical protein CspeluHIS016_0702970 [Cutaneotrichosporon spelunceum]